MNFVLQTRNFVLQTRNFVLQTRNFVSKTRSSALKTRNLVFKMMNFAAMNLKGLPDSEKRKHGVFGHDAIVELNFEQLEYLWWECISFQSGAQEEVIRSGSNDTKVEHKGRARAKTGVEKMVLSTETKQLLKGVPIQVRNDALARLYKLISKVQQEKLVKSFTQSVTNKTIADKMLRKVRLKQDSGFTVYWVKRVQARWRMFVLRETFLEYRRHIIRIQAWWRGLRTRNHLNDTLKNTVWSTLSGNTVYVANVIGELEIAGKLTKFLAKSFGRVLNCELRLREWPEAPWALVTFHKPNIAKMALDCTQEKWAVDVIAQVEMHGLKFATVDIDKALASTGAFGWTFKKAQKNVHKVMYKMQKERRNRIQHRHDMKQSRQRLEGADESPTKAGSLTVVGDAGGHAQRERVAARVAMERAQCLCPLSRLPMSHPVVAADGFVYERAAISRWLGSSQRGMVSPVTGQPMENAVLIPHRALAAAAHAAEQHDATAGGIMGGALVHGYTASLRVTEMLGAGMSTLSTASVAAGEGEGWDGDGAAMVNLADKNVAQAALRHGIKVSRDRQRSTKDKERHGSDEAVAAAIAAVEAAEDDHMVTPHGARQRSIHPGRCEVTGRPGRSLRVSVPGDSGSTNASPSPRGSPSSVGEQRRRPSSASGQRRASTGHAGNHGKGGLGGGGGNASLGMKLSQAEVIGLSPRYWPDTPTTAKDRPRQQRHSASPAKQMRIQVHLMLFLRCSCTVF